MTEKDIINAFIRIRKIDNTIPDEVLDLMKVAAIGKLQELQRPEKIFPDNEKQFPEIDKFSKLEESDLSKIECSLDLMYIISKKIITDLLHAFNGLKAEPLTVQEKQIEAAVYDAVQFIEKYKNLKELTNALYVLGNPSSLMSLNNEPEGIKTAERVRDYVAIEYGYLNWQIMLTILISKGKYRTIEDAQDEVTRIYATQIGEAVKQMCAEKAKTKLVEVGRNGSYEIVDRESIMSCNVQELIK